MEGERIHADAVKVILVGNGSAGKTSIANRFKQDGFQRVYKQTIGIDFYERDLLLRGRTVHMQVWDIGGQSISSAMLGQYVWGAGIVFLIYDVTDAQSFRDVEDWLALVRKRPTSADVPASATPPDVYLVGNKIDLAHLRKISNDTHEKFILDNALTGGFYISARSGDHVLTAFYEAAARRVGIILTKEELAMTEKVLGVVAVRGDDEARTAVADDIEKADLEAERRKHTSCCAIQ